MQLINPDEFLFPQPEGSKRVSLYLAHRPGAKSKAYFTWVKLNGEPLLDDLDQIDLPGQQGWYVDIGPYREGGKITLDWELRTKSVPLDLHVSLGVFFNGKLRPNIVLVKDLLLDPFEVYPGTGTFTV